MSKEINDKKLRYFIGDVRDLNRLKRAFNNIDYQSFMRLHSNKLFSSEYNPIECIKLIMVLKNIINAAIDCGVKSNCFIY